MSEEKKETQKAASTIRLNIPASNFFSAALTFYESMVKPDTKKHKPYVESFKQTWGKDGFGTVNCFISIVVAHEISLAYKVVFMEKDLIEFSALLQD